MTEYDAEDERDEEYTPTGDAYTRYLHMETGKETNALKKRIEELEKFTKYLETCIESHRHQNDNRHDQFEGRLLKLEEGDTACNVMNELTDIEQVGMQHNFKKLKKRADKHDRLMVELLDRIRTLEEKA